MAGAIVYSVLGCYAVSFATGRMLVAGFRPFTNTDVPVGPTAIVVLGSGTFSARDWDDGRIDMLDRASASRVLEAFRVFKMTDAAWVIASGGLIQPDDFDEPNGRTMRDVLARLGVPPARLLVETESTNTHDEAVIVRDMLKRLPVQHVILVTSDNGPEMETWPDAAYTPFRCAKGSTWEGGVRVPATGDPSGSRLLAGCQRPGEPVGVRSQRRARRCDLLPVGTSRAGR